MTAEDAGRASVRFSTADLAPADRIPFFRGVCGRNVVRLEIEPLAGCPFHAEAVLRALPGIGISSTVNSPMRVERTRDLLSDGNDDLLLAITKACADIVSQRGSEATLSDFSIAASGAGSAPRRRNIVVAPPLRSDVGSAPQRQMAYLHIAPGVVAVAPISGSAAREATWSPEPP